MAITTGEWEFDQDLMQIHTESGHGGLVADICEYPDPNNDGVDNGRLIASAKRLREASCRVLHAMESEPLRTLRIQVALSDLKRAVNESSQPDQSEG